jgi:hypothetical protein
LRSPFRDLHFPSFLSLTQVAICLNSVRQIAVQRN